MILNFINHADDEELQEIALAVCRARERKYPSDQEVFLSLPVKDLKEREQVLRLFTEFMMRHIPE